MPTPRRVLILDDDQDTVSIFEAFLSHHGYEIVSARTAAEAAEIFGSTPPDILILDLHLPDMSGLTFLERLKGEAISHDVPVICFTALSDPENRRKAEKLGCSAYIMKPAEPQAMLDAVKEILPLLQVPL